jgi:hypothetical protein
MAKVKGPMHSDSAGGQFGKNMIFRSGKKGTVVTGYYKPGSAKKFTLSEAQLAQRQKYGEAVEAWRALTNEEREIFNENAKAQNISGWNLYFKNYSPVPPPSYPEFSFNGHTYQINPVSLGELVWGPMDFETEAYSETDGQANTNILAGLGSDYEAAKACADLVTGGFDDWFLPSKDELLAGVIALGSAVFPNDLYWSSSQFASLALDRAWDLYTGDTTMYDSNKENAETVLAFRIKE